MTKNRYGRNVLRSLLVPAAVAGWLGRQQDAGAPPIPQVEVITETPQTVSDEPEFVGQTETSRPVGIRSQVTGIVKEWSFHEGGDVQKGGQALPKRPSAVPGRRALRAGEVRLAEARPVQA